MKLAILLSAYLCLTKVAYSQRAPQSHGKKKCTVRELQKCMSFLQVVTDGNDSALPATRDDLRRTCGDLESGVKCLDKHSSQCFSQEQALVFEDLVNPAKEFINQLCDNGRTESEFLRHASCFRNISLDVDKCASKYRDAIKASSNATESQNPEKSIKLSCCSLRKFIQCKFDYVGRDCGVEAETFMRDHLARITHPLLERHCAAYTFGSHACSEVLLRDHEISDATHSIHSRILVSATIIVVSLLRQH